MWLAPLTGKGRVCTSLGCLVPTAKRTSSTDRTETERMMEGDIDARDSIAGVDHAKSLQVAAVLDAQP